MNLSSTIVLNKIPEQFYRPRTAVDRSPVFVTFWGIKS